jgi:lipopolysaccharide biosynthesis glycosyltransferase
LPDLLPKLKKILYLDCDIVVIKDISKLYAMDIDNYSFAAVPQYGDHRLQDLHLPVGTKYFNSGIMLINMEWRRTSHMTKKILTFIKKSPEILMYHDQDAMNALMRDTRLPLSSKYNYMTSVLESHLIDYKKVRKDIAIIHYTRLKPWNYLCVNPLKKDYFYYLAKTPWKNRKFIDKTFKNVCIYLWRFVV